MLRISLDAIPLAAPRTGVGHYTFELARHLAHLAPEDEFELVSPFKFAAPLTGEADQQLPANLRIVQPKVNSVSRRWFAVGLPFYLKQAGGDLFHGTNYEVPLWGKPATVLTVHDLSLLLHPETHEARLVRRGRSRLPLMARTASVIITPSESVRREVCEHLGIDARKVISIPEAPRDIFRPASVEETAETRRRLGIEEEFILFVGTIEPRKNLLALVAAFEDILRSTPHCPQLVIAGKEGWLNEELHSRIRSSGVEKNLRFTGYLTDEDLRALYSSCRVFVYPSLYEGFGLPPLEAMACGAPVIASRIPSIVEAVGPDAARLISPTDPQALAASIVRLLDDENERRRLSRTGRERASLFSWEKTARATLDVYRKALL
ncbi:MAG TPA: glycosyltransferase family 1 protein [Pyrinomonadaceae bacterium]|nr:glycosyltransferase family 1 protein [Pyrinomonadaceae bacterium]